MKFIRGLRNAKIRKQLLQVEDLTAAVAQSKAQAIEMSGISSNETTNKIQSSQMWPR